LHQIDHRANLKGDRSDGALIERLRQSGSRLAAAAQRFGFAVEISG